MPFQKDKVCKRKYLRQIGLFLEGRKVLHKEGLLYFKTGNSLHKVRGVVESIKSKKKRTRGFTDVLDIHISRHLAHGHFKS